jgi:hypothetical protein
MLVEYTRYKLAPERQGALEAVRPFIPDIQEMRHYERTPVRGEKGRKSADMPAGATEGEP